MSSSFLSGWVLVLVSPFFPSLLIPSYAYKTSTHFPLSLFTYFHRPADENIDTKITEAVNAPLLLHTHTPRTRRHTPLISVLPYPHSFPPILPPFTHPYRPDDENIDTKIMEAVKARLPPKVDEEEGQAAVAAAAGESSRK